MNVTIDLVADAAAFVWGERARRQHNGRGTRPRGAADAVGGRGCGRHRGVGLE